MVKERDPRKGEIRFWANRVLPRTIPPNFEGDVLVHTYPRPFKKYTIDRDINSSLRLTGFPSPRTATYVIAAFNASAESQAQADLLCSGADDQVEINTALRSLPIAGVKVVMTEGTYRLSGPILIGDNVTLEGYGDSTRLQAQANMIGLIINSNHGVRNNRFMKISNMLLDGNNFTCSGVDFDFGAALNGHNWLDKLHIIRTRDGIHSRYGYETMVHNCQIGDFENISPTRYGIFFEECYDSYCNDNHIIQCGSHGIYWTQLVSAHTGVINGNYLAHNTGRGIFTEAHDSVVISGNISEQNVSDNIWCAGGNSVVTGNRAGASTNGSGIVILAYTNCVVTGNIVHTNVAANQAGIYLGGPLITCTGNQVRGNQYGIYCYATSYVTVTGNAISDSVLDGIYVRATPGSADFLCIIGNAIEDNDRYGINIADVDCEDTLIKNNTYHDNVSGNLNDLGTRTKVHSRFIPVPNPNGNIGDHPCFVLTDGADTTHRVELPIPDDFHSVVTCAAVVVPGGTGNFRRTVDTDFGVRGASEAYNTHSDNIAIGLVAVTQNELENIDITAALTGITTRDSVGVAFQRAGNHADDTVNADCYFIGLELRYV